SLLGHMYEVETVLAGQQVQVRFDPYDLSEIQVWRDGTRRENARPLKLRDPKHPRAKVPETEPEAPSTGLNYVELLYAEHLRQTERNQGNVLRDLLQGGEKR